MRVCILDGQKVKNKEMLHDALSHELALPDWYGRNLDALYDCLTDIREETEIQLLNESVLKENLGDYIKILMKVIYMAAKENPQIRWKTEE